MVLLMFVMSFITLMLADSEYNSRTSKEGNNRYSELKTYHQVFVAMKRPWQRAAAEENLDGSRDATEVRKSLKIGESVSQVTQSANWTDIISKWQQGIKQERNYSYLTNNVNLCKGLSDQRIVILVYSAINNFQKRLSLRSTWADPHIVDKKRFTIVFLLGKTNEKTEQNSINSESEKYGDIVQGDFLDVYHNLTHKGLFGFQWVMDFCQNARLVLKVDDDVFVDIFKILENYRDESYEKGHLACQLREIGTSPITRDGRWKLDEKYFPGQIFYPFRHCNGYFVMLSLDVVGKLFETSRLEPKLWIDDVYLFGVLPSKLKSFNMTQLTNNLSLYEDQSMACFGNIVPCRLLMGYTYNQGSVEKLWKLSLMNSYTFVEKYGNLGYIFIKSIKLNM